MANRLQTFTAPTQWRLLRHKRKHMTQPSSYKQAKTRLSDWLQSDSPLWQMTLLVLVMLLSGCTVPPIVPCVAPAIPTVPVLQQPLPKETYSISVQRDLSKWEQRLTLTPQMSKP